MANWLVPLAISRQILRGASSALLYLLAHAAFPHQSLAQSPVYEVSPVESSIKFDVESYVAIKGNFSKWNATLTFQSREVASGVLDIRIEADSVDSINHKCLPCDRSISRTSNAPDHDGFLSDCARGKVP
jgi:polyisoprenoid-binding protein YceI